MTRRTKPLTHSKFKGAPLDRKAYHAFYMRTIFRPKVAKMLKAMRALKPALKEAIRD